MSSWTFSVSLYSQPPVKCLCFSILCKLCQKQFFGTDVHIWREMSGCRLFKVLSHRLFFFPFILRERSHVLGHVLVWSCGNPGVILISMCSPAHVLLAELFVFVLFC